MSATAFFKVCGSGNDFVMMDGRVTSIADWPRDRIARVCARATGVGADGLVIIGPGSASGAVAFTYFNADGSSGAMCGNAALCATRLAVHLGLSAPGQVRLETAAGVVLGRSSPDGQPRAELILPDVDGVQSPPVEAGPGESRMGFSVVGVPHLVVPVQDIDGVDVPTRGRELRFHAGLGPAGANVNFVARVPDGWRMRTYERGVEAETLACGTGAVACAAALARWGVASLPWSVVTSAGSILTVSGVPGADGRLRAPQLAGEARIVFEGKLGPDI